MGQSCVCSLRRTTTGGSQRQGGGLIKICLLHCVINMPGKGSHYSSHTNSNKINFVFNKIVFIFVIMKDQQIDQQYLATMAKKVQYYWDDQDECFIKSVPGQGFFAKFKGKEEYQVDDDSDLVMLAVFSGTTATKAEYDKY